MVYTWYISGLWYVYFDDNDVQGVGVAQSLSPCHQLVYYKSWGVYHEEQIACFGLHLTSRLHNSQLLNSKGLFNCFIVMFDSILEYIDTPYADRL